MIMGKTSQTDKKHKYPPKSKSYSLSQVGGQKKKVIYRRILLAKHNLICWEKHNKNHLVSFCSCCDSSKLCATDWK